MFKRTLLGSVLCITRYLGLDVDVKEILGALPVAALVIVTYPVVAA